MRRVAKRRLAEISVTGEAAERLLDEQPELGDHWLAYLVLAPLSVIEDMLHGGSGG
jgi:hypothetical protein